MTAPLVEAEHLSVHYPVASPSMWDRVRGRGGAPRVVRAVDDVSLTISPGTTLGLVGESGCGKSTLGRALLRLVEATSGRVVIRGTDIGRLSATALRRERRHMQMIFQDPYASLDPRMTVGQIIAEAVDTAGVVPAADRERHVRHLMDTVGLSARLHRRYPHEFSGGQQQRVGIARALATEPAFIVADEPISALDVSIQAQVINLLEELQRDRGLTYLFISHDLRAVRHTSHRIAVMYLGQIVEEGPAAQVSSLPLMPYTRALMSAVPVPDPVVEATRTRIVLHGDVPSPITPPAGCRFHTRCAYAVPECAALVPPLVEIRPDHWARCVRLSPAAPDITLLPAGETPGLATAATGSSC